MPVRNVAIFGSTGVIGTCTIQVIEHLRNEMRVTALVANRNSRLLIAQARRLRPEFAVILDESQSDYVRRALADTGIKVRRGTQGMIEVADSPGNNTVVMGLTGTIGLEATLAALRRRKRVAIATKEIIVGFGEFVMADAERYQAEVLPVDSELSAIHQCLAGHQREEIARVVLTASGGPMLNRTDLSEVNVEQALRHPVWRMGRKITIDSATLMNKGLELIEAARFFALGPEQLEVLVHPESVVHSLVELRDGSMLAQLAMPDMRLPVQYALTYPRRFPGLVARTRLERLGALTFRRPDLRRFPALRLADRALRAGGCRPCVLNVANDAAVEAFLNRRIGFQDITRIVARTMRAVRARPTPSLVELKTVEREARQVAERICSRIAVRRDGEASSMHLRSSN